MKLYKMTATFGKLTQETLTLQPGLNIIEAGHYYTEAPVLADLARLCRELCGAECVLYDSNLTRTVAE